MRKTIRAFALMAVAAIALAGCAAGTEAGAGGTADASDPSLEPVKIGMIGAVGSVSDNHVDIIAGAEAGIAGINERGGLNGHRVELVFCNDKFEPNEGAKCAREMVEEEVVAMVGIAGGAVSVFNVSPILADAGIPVVAIETSDPAVWNGKNAFLPLAPAPLVYEAALAYAVHEDLLPMAIAFADYPASHEYADMLEATLSELGADGFAAQVAVQPESADYAAVAAALDASGAKSVLTVLGAPQTLGVCRAMAERGSAAALVGISPVSTADMTAVGPCAGQYVTASAVAPIAEEHYSTLVSELAAIEQGGSQDAALDRVTAYTAFAWIGTQIIDAVVTPEMEDITAATVTQALTETVDLDLGGVIEPWSGSAEGAEGLSRISSPAAWFWTFENGAYTALNDAPIARENLLSGDFEVRTPSALD